MTRTFYMITDLIVSLVLLLLIGLGFYFIYSLTRSTPFYPSKTGSIDKAFDALKIKFDQNSRLLGGQAKFVDLGSGDGRTLIWAAKKGMQAFGIEENPYLSLWARFKVNLFFRKYRKNIKVINGSFYKVNLANYDIVYMYIYREHMNKLKEKLFKELKPGSIILSNTFKFSGIEPARSFERFHVYEVKKT